MTSPANSVAAQVSSRSAPVSSGSVPHLFQALTLRSVTAKNRIMLSPMCQYCATDGVPDDWHFQHLAARAVGGTGIVFSEATHVEARGRITAHCLGLWNDFQRDAFARIVAFVKGQGALAGIQLAHAGRKASTARPVDGGKPLGRAAGAWDVIGPSAIPFDLGFPVPAAMDRGDIESVLGSYASAARRAREAGFEIIELHAAHGYLLHSFLSPSSNHRNDEYGGTLENRARLLLRTIDAVRTQWPDDLPLFVRLSCTDWIDGAWDIESSVEVAKMLKQHGGVDVIDCSSGGGDARAVVRAYPGYQVGFAETIRRRVGIPTAAVGLIHSPDMAEHVLADGAADLVVLGRTLLGDPYWPLKAAKRLHTDITWPYQYKRADIFD